MNTAASSAAILRGLRRPGDEPQLTSALAETFKADPTMGAQFLGAIFDNLTDGRAPKPPAALRCTTEETVDDGRVDLRFRAAGWDVIVELKIHAGYGHKQLDRYLGALSGVDYAFLAAITRSVPRYGEPASNVDSRWLGSVQWRRLLPQLRAMQSTSADLNSQWPLFLDVLAEEGSMGFTNPQPELFRVLGNVRTSGNHVAEFVRAVQIPLHAALIDALGGDESAAAIYVTRGGGLYVGKSWNGIIETAFRVPPGGPPAVRAGVFGFNPPVRFFVAPHRGRRWAARLTRLEPEAQRAVRFLLERDFRDYDLHAFLELDDARLLSPRLETEVVEWAHARFVDIVESGLLAFMVDTPDAGNPEEDAAEIDEASA